MTRRIFPAFSIFLAACGVFGSSDDASEIPAPPEPGRPQESVAPPEAKAPPLPGKPKDDEINEGFGVFVSASAAEGGDGTRAKPYRMIAAGLDEAVKQRKRLYVCTGTFEEAVKIRNGIPMVGGFDCTAPAWTLSGARTTVKSPASPAIVAEDIDVPTRVVGFDVVAPDAADPGGSSIGMLANKAGALQIASSKITAGKAQAGAAGEEGTQLFTAATAAGKPGAAEEDFVKSPLYQLTRNAGGAPGTNVCVGAAGFAGEPGGNGGNGGGYDCAQVVVIDATVYRWAVVTTAANITLTPTSGEIRTGAAGAQGSDGASASALGLFSESGFVPADGAAGTNGGGGKGGSGGNGGPMTSSICTKGHVGESASGPGGGAGGCPGLAGTAGKGGGASIGVLALGSAGLAFDACEIVAGSGGAGGRGTLGSSPTEGGLGGTASGTSTAAGAGGPGGRAGVSGSGAGGPSIAIAHTGGEPKVENGTTLKPGTAGAGVPEETATDALGNVKTLPASAAGVAKDLFAF